MTLNAVPLELFRTWQYGYGGKSVRVVKAGTSALLQVYSDPTLVTQVDNPITLASLDVNGISYGMYPQPLYVGEAYQLIIGNQTSAVYRPFLNSLSGENLSEGLAMTRRGGFLRPLEDMLDNLVFVKDYGPMIAAGLTGASPAQNNETITTALGAAAGQGGGFCVLPAGSFEFLNVAIPQNVILIGQGRGATVLQSAQAQDVVTLTGPGAGMSQMTLDGINLFPGSVGVKMIGIDTTRFSSVEVKRFATGIYGLGGRQGRWDDLWVTNCQKGADLQGNSDAAASTNGDEWTGNYWIGGGVRQHTVFGLSLSYEDRRVSHNVFRDISFEDNSQTAVLINGAQFSELDDCTWTNNVTDIDIHDDDVVLLTNENKVINTLVSGGLITGGTIRVSGRAQDVRFDTVELRAATVTLTQPLNQILFVDTIEDAQVAVTGDTIKLARWRRLDRGEITGVTTDNGAITAWEHTFIPGEVGFAVATVTANQRNGNLFATFYKAVGARCAGSTLAYDNQTGNFTLGNFITGTTSGARGLIVADNDLGAHGTLTLRSIVGAFIDNELLNDGATGAGQANGLLVAGNVALDNVGGTDLRPAATPFTQVAYDVETHNFLLGGTLTGGSSGAQGKIVGLDDDGTTGRIWLVTADITNGPFIDGETITDGGGGSATVNGAPTIGHGWTVTFVPSLTRLQLQVNGFNSQTVDWKVRVDYMAG
jgi:hypothetical protein